MAQTFSDVTDDPDTLEITPDQSRKLEDTSADESPTNAVNDFRRNQKMSISGSNYPEPNAALQVSHKLCAITDTENKAHIADPRIFYSFTNVESTNNPSMHKV